MTNLLYYWTTNANHSLSSVPNVSAFLPKHAHSAAKTAPITARPARAPLATRLEALLFGLVEVDAGAAAEAGAALLDGALVGAAGAAELEEAGREDEDVTEEDAADEDALEDVVPAPLPDTPVLPDARAEAAAAGIVTEMPICAQSCRRARQDQYPAASLETILKTNLLAQKRTGLRIS
ncbi:hypothetical protein EMMF5_006011 [Cystobasidiomycetes sp. EMM_F5]